MKESSQDENIFQEADNTRDDSVRTKLEMASVAESGSLQNTLEMIDSSIGHDQPVTEKDLAELCSVVKKLKLNIGGKEVALKAVEDIATVNSFLAETNVGWGVKEEDLPVFRCEFIDPKGLKYGEKKRQVDKDRFGEYTLNPETFGIDFEKAKIFIPDLSPMEGKGLHEVFQYVVDRFGDKYRIPGIEYWKWMIENPEKVDKDSPELKDGNWYYLPGSLVRRSDGGWSVPCARWDGSRWSRSTDWLGNGWYSGYRVVLLEI